ncbi:DUF2933 domain-containing protein [Leptolyngbya iicbica]|uniref:DUF2933 domain-containing protein n=2 Tax=Cyanophyceae TaxID=3028117 RepID=A0A4Q7E923_9CYAN|nr:DUF2933 domain-containing protein [Leptolyngbya sp. LK]RZM79112.1 DUF2933 domain-containing protein [Leptolyngbya sp. LK]
MLKQFVKRLRLRSPMVLGLLFCLGILVAVAIAPFWTNFPAFTLYALLLLCPLMHLFLHGRMHSHHNHSSSDPSPEKEQ